MGLVSGACGDAPPVPALGGWPTVDSAQKHQRGDGRSCPQRQPLPAQACRPRVLSVAPSTLAESSGPSTGGLGAADHCPLPEGLGESSPLRLSPALVSDVE